MLVLLMLAVFALMIAYFCYSVYFYEIGRASCRERV